MASTKQLVFQAVFAVLLVQASWCAVARAATLQQGFHAVMTVTSFEQNGGGGGPAACDGQFHGNGDLIAAVSAEEYAGGSRCGKPVRVWNSVRTDSVRITVVDETDCQTGCIATSKAVWDALTLDTNIGEVAVTWADE